MKPFKNYRVSGKASNNMKKFFETLSKKHNIPLLINTKYKGKELIGVQE